MFSMLMLFSCAKLSSFEAEKASVPVPVPSMSESASPEEKHGALLYRVSGCVGCHSPPFPNAEHLGGRVSLAAQLAGIDATRSDG